jgi:hypothetical protein
LAREVEHLDWAAPLAAAQLDEGASPLLLKGAVAHWPALSKWTPERLGRDLEPFEVRYKVSASNVHPDFRQTTPRAMFARREAPFSEFLRLISTGDDAERARYLFTGDEQFLLRRRDGVTSVDPSLAPLLSDVEVPPFFADAQLYTVWCWFSGRGVRTWLHYDNNGCHNLNAQVTGRKRCWLYPPEELPRLHPFLLGGSNPAHNCSSVDVERPGPEHAADLANATVFEAELEAGDLLFIPAWWFHTFVHLGEFNSNVNFWWKPARPRFNAVAARQALLDAAQQAKLDLSNPETSRTLQALDAAAILGRQT